MLAKNATLPSYISTTALGTAALFIAFSLVSAAANAQVVPGSISPAHIDERFRQPVAPQEQPGPAPTITVPPTPISDKLAQRFVLRSVQIDDSTVYAQGAFDSLYRDKIGQTLILGEAREIARAITTRYRNDGYVLSQAVIPNQDLSTGVLHIRIVEGFVDKVYIQNDNPDRDGRNLIAAYAEKIKAQHPLNTKTLERYMLLIDDLPGVKARAIIRPSPATFGAADLIIQVKNKGIEASATLDNRGNKFIGPYQAQLTLTENSLLGLGERTTIRGINAIPTAGLHFFDIQHEEQIGSEGTRITLLAARAETHPGDSFSAADLRGSSDDYMVTVSHPFLRSRASNLTGRVTFDARNSENDQGGFEQNEDKVRAVRVGANYDTGDRLDGVDMADLSGSKGVDWLGATSDGVGRSRVNGDQDFTKFNLDLSRVQNLPAGFSVLTAASGQYTTDALLASEQFTLGGVGFGQAYDSGEISGDKGIAGKVELRYGQPVGAEWFDSYQLYGYYDIGSVYINDNIDTGLPSKMSLASAGPGIRANFTQNLYGYAEVGFPLTRDIGSEGNKDPRFFFSITGRY